MIFANFIKFFSSNTVGSLMNKYLLFIIVFLFSFMINITVSRGETVIDIKTNDMDVYNNKTKVFRKWDKKGLGITKTENKLLSLYPEQITKKKIKSLPVVQASEVKIIRKVTEGKVKLEPPEVSKKTSTPLADSILNFSFKPSIAQMEKKLLLLHPEQIIKKKEIKSQPVVQASEVKIIRNLVQSMVNFKPSEVSKKKSASVADSILISSFKPVKAKEKLKIAVQEDKTLIYGNNFERDCYLNKKDCGFSMSEEVKQYSKKISPQKERVDTTRFPIDLN
tara:strand:- start:3375 stop:4211 length:837 start_codon:yes stop_codon:yes gene_type:complete